MNEFHGQIFDDEDHDEQATLTSSLESPVGTYGSLSENGKIIRQRRRERFHSNIDDSASNQEGDSDVDDEEEEEEDVSSEEDDDEEEDDEISYLDSSDDEEAMKKLRTEKYECTFLDPISRPIIKLYNLVRDAVILITDTDAVWDSPAYAKRPRSGSIQHYTFAGEKHVTFRHKVVVLFWFIVFITFYALERFSFKVMVDRMGPFRMVVAAELVLGVHGALGGAWVLLQYLCRKKKSKKRGFMIPLADIGLMAVLDTVQLLLVVISSSHVAPTLTAIIVHVTIPFTTLITSIFQSIENKALRQDGQETQKLFGVSMIFLSSILAVSPAILTLIYPSHFSKKDIMANRSAWNTLLFFFSFIPGAISQVYKEKTLATYAQPVDPHFLNVLLSLFSFAFSFIVSPVFYPLQGFVNTPSTPESGSDIKVQSWIHMYPTRGISDNFSDGLRCFLGTLSDETQIRGYPEEAHCDFGHALVLLYVASTMIIGYSIGKICSAGAMKILHRGISMGIIVSVVLLFFYQVFVDDVDYGIFPTFYHCTCAGVLVIGSEIYHKVTLETPSFETVYPVIDDLYDED
jgi:hypothetical protein